MNWFDAAAVLSAAVCLLHVFGGGITTARPLLRSSLGDEAKFTNYYCWHMVTIVIATMAGLYFMAARNENHFDFAVLATLLAYAFAVWSLILTIWKRQRVKTLPQWTLFLVIGVVGYLGVQADVARAEDDAMKIGYLEIVAADVDAVCAAYEAALGVEFGEAIAALGDARTAKLADGGRIGVRAPMRPDEEPVIRPYVVVDDINAALAAAEAAGATIALPRMELGDQGACGIYILEGTGHGLWEMP